MVYEKGWRSRYERYLCRRAYGVLADVMEVGWNEKGLDT